jgi:formiminotetrahydrofolate cyclodeaminase
MGKFEIDTALASLSLKQFVDQTNREHPEITGGCVLLTGAGLSTAMILMALKISHKRNIEIVAKQFLRRKISFMSTIQVQLFIAAENDMEIFNEYRAAMKSKSKYKATKLTSNLKKATESLLEAVVVLTKAIDESRSCLPYTDVTVVSDVEGGILLLEATLKGIQNMADSNKHIMEKRSH